MQADRLKPGLRALKKGRAVGTARPQALGVFKLLRVVFLDFDAVEPVRAARSWRRAAVDEVEDFAGAGGDCAGGGPGRVVEVVLELQQVAEAGLGLNSEGRRAGDNARVDDG